MVDSMQRRPPEAIGVAIVTFEERVRGWLAVIATEKPALPPVVGYRALTWLFEFYQQFEIAQFDEAAASRLVSQYVTGARRGKRNRYYRESPESLA
jgi:hypothetical protein